MCELVNCIPGLQKKQRALVNSWLNALISKSSYGTGMVINADESVCVIIGVPGSSSNLQVADQLNTTAKHFLLTLAAWQWNLGSGKDEYLPQIRGLQSWRRARFSMRVIRKFHIGSHCGLWSKICSVTFVFLPVHVGVRGKKDNNSEDRVALLQTDIINTLKNIGRVESIWGIESISILWLHNLGVNISIAKNGRFSRPPRGIINLHWIGRISCSTLMNLLSGDRSTYGSARSVVMMISRAT